jgi:KUP system potassium uptake protein
VAVRHGEAVPRPGGSRRSTVAAAGLTLGALGIVFGDIGTSPLYAVQQVFTGAHTIEPEPDRIYGVISLIFWSLMIIVSLKYVTLIMRVNNEGEGGIMALISLVQRTVLKHRIGLVLLGLVGASLFYGDGMITPAISVLSAVEGLEIATPGLDAYVVPIAAVILTALFAIQRFGTATVGALFGPVMIVWFAVLAALGLAKVVQEPGIARALSPSYAVMFFVDHGGTAFLALGSVVLAVTGAEALYADMGHFGRSPIRRAWFYIVFPALLLNYMGQGALLLDDPGAVDSPFYRLAPDELQLPLVFLATAATVIASQAVISGAFSVTRQAIQLGFLPRMHIRHTSGRQIGQIYIPAVNWLLLIAVLALVLGFRSSAHLASAYGIAVTGTFAIDTILFFSVVYAILHKRLWVAVIGTIAFVTVDLAFFGANLTKIAHGGWFPIAVASVVLLLLATWRRGRLLALERTRDVEISVGDFLAQIDRRPPARVPGTAVFLTATGDGVPPALLYNVEHNHVLHEHVCIFTAQTHTVPQVPDNERLRVQDLGRGLYRVVAGYGFQEEPDIPGALDEARAVGVPVDTADTSYFLNRVIFIPTNRPGMAVWRKRLFAVISRNAANAAGFFRLPSDQVIEIGTRVEL